MTYHYGIAQTTDVHYHHCLGLSVHLFCLFVGFDSLRPINNFSVKQGRVFLVEPVLS